MTGTPRGFSIIEALVATTIVGVASTLLVGALTVRTAARRHALRDSAGARALAEVSAIMARRPCGAADTAGTTRLRAGEASVTVHWRAERTPSGWAFMDSALVADTVVTGAGRIACS